MKSRSILALTVALLWIVAPLFAYAIPVETLLGHSCCHPVEAFRAAALEPSTTPDCCFVAPSQDANRQGTLPAVSHDNVAVAPLQAHVAVVSAVEAHDLALLVPASPEAPPSFSPILRI